LIDKWDQLKEQFTSNFAGTMGRSGTHMDLAMVKQEQGETLHKYMWRFFRQARHCSRCHRQGSHRPFPRRSLPSSHL
jgi:hypothetical protein